MPGSVEFYFGPDGVGKTTIVNQLQAADPELVVLNGTNIASWPDNHPDLVAEYLAEGIPYASQFMEKAALTTRTALGIAATGRNVVIDGPALHKTVMNIAARMTIVPGIQQLPVLRPRRLVTHKMLRPHFNALAVPNVTHVCVTLSGRRDPGLELQERIEQRGERSSWDPQSRVESFAQINAAVDLAEVLMNRKGHTVRFATSEL